MLILILVLVVIIALAAFLLKSFFRAQENNITYRHTETPSQTSPKRESTLDGMDEGDYHSGPEGYSPNTAYPETQYGSMFDEEADWNEDERDR